MKIVTVDISDIPRSSDFYEMIMETERLPNGHVLPHTAFYRDSVVHDWTGRPCSRCRGTGEFFCKETSSWHCRECAGTGEEYGPLWLWEE